MVIKLNNKLQLNKNIDQPEGLIKTKMALTFVSMR